ncbi:hypothetical protein [Rossellomorea marisflavi]|uniref:hypothetical protein n=1 Tax=Rossellomorea marisflavi TaxID=189381 RepID=UPI003F9EC0A0
MTQVPIMKDKSGFLGFRVGNELIGLLEKESLLLSVKNPTRDLEEVGYIDFDKRVRTHIYNTSNVSSHINHKFANSNPDKEIFILGNISEKDTLTFIPMNETTLMGYVSKDKSLHQSYGSVYFFQKVGEVMNSPIYAYMHDMVVKKDEIKWVTAIAHTTTPHKSDVKTKDEFEKCLDCYGTGITDVDTGSLCIACEGTGEV